MPEVSSGISKVLLTAPSVKTEQEEEPAVVDLSRFRFGSRWGQESEPVLKAFSDWTEKYLAGTTAERAAMESDGLALAQERRSVFKGLIQKQPKLALAEATPVVVRNQLPESITSLLEERVTGRGDLLVLGRTDARSVPTISRRVVIGEQMFDAHVFGDRLAQKTSRRISLHGVAVDGSLALSDSPLRAFEEDEPVPSDKPLAAGSCVISQKPTAPTADGPRPRAVAAESADKVYWLCRGGHLSAAAEGVAAQEAATAAIAYSNIGDRSVLVMMVDFPDFEGGATTPTIALNTIASVGTFIQSNSFGEIRFPTRVVTPILRLPRSSSVYANDANGDTILLDDARTAARDAGFDPASYDFDIAVFADINFPWAGQGYVGDKGSWVQGSFAAGTTAHELGHNLGLWHANSWISSVPTSTSGSHDEYGNVFDVMGRSSNFPLNHYNANFKYLLGWLPLTNIQTVTTSGTYRVYAHDQNSKIDGRKYAARIPIGIVAGGEVEDYWIDFRQALATRYPATASGAIVQWGNDNGTQSASRLIDSNPNTSTMEDAPLAVNRTLNDLDNSVEITVIQKGGTGAEAFIDLQIDISLPPVIDLDQALDTADMVWTTSAPPWTGERSITHDGSDAAVSGAATPNSGRSYVETTVNGPGAISFWWKVSSEETFDYLRLQSDGQELARISGEVDWEFRSYELGPGTHTLRWAYEKDASAAEGSDRGWLDQVKFETGDRPPQINFHPIATSAAAGDIATFRVDASGSSPLFYYWLRENVSIPWGTNISLILTNVQFAQAGNYSVIVSNAFGTVTSDPALLTVQQAVPLSDALDYSTILWTSAGSANWRGQQDVTHDGLDAAQSGAIIDGRESTLSGTFVGPGTLSFWWKVSSEESFDHLSLYLDNKLVEKHSGEFDWSPKELIIPNGAHQVRWSYTKDASVGEGMDAAWVDEITYNFTPNMPPIVLTHPGNQEVSLGGTAVFSAEFLGSEPMEFQWYRNDVPLQNGPSVTGANTPRLMINAVSEEASYSVKVKNGFGEEHSAAAALILVPLSLGDSVEQSTRPWVTGGSGAWAAGTAVTHDGIDAAVSPVIFEQEEVWFETTVIGPGSISFWWRVESEPDYDLLSFEIDGFSIASISGNRNWDLFRADYAAGEHVVRWVYRKDADVSRWSDAGWVDQIEIVNNAPQPQIQGVRLESGELAGTISGLVPFSGQIVLETSSNLTNWTGISTNPITSGSVNFRNNAAGNAQFLRAKVQ